MSEIIMCQILYLLTLLAILAYVYFSNIYTAKERQQLYDRIQAKDFTEYKQMAEPIKVKIKEEKENVYVEL